MATIKKSPCAIVTIHLFLSGQAHWSPMEGFHVVLQALCSAQHNLTYMMVDLRAVAVQYATLNNGIHEGQVYLVYWPPVPSVKAPRSDCMSSASCWENQPTEELPQRCLWSGSVLCRKMLQQSTQGCFFFRLAGKQKKNTYKNGSRDTSAQGLTFAPNCGLCVWCFCHILIFLFKRGRHTILTI